MTAEILTFASKLIERQGLKKAVFVVLVIGATLSLVLYTFPPIFEAIGEIASFELRDAYAQITK